MPRLHRHGTDRKGFGISQQVFLQCKTSRCIYVCIACGCYETSQRAFQIWKSFCNQDRPFSSSTWSGRLFFCTKIFEFATAASRASWYHLASFEPDFLQIQLQNTCWASPKPDIPHKIVLATRFRWYRISKFLGEKFVLWKSALIHLILHQTRTITSGFEGTAAGNRWSSPPTWRWMRYSTHKIPLMPASMTAYWKCAFRFPALGSASGRRTRRKSWNAWNF